MYFVLIQRCIRMPRRADPGDKYATRSANVIDWTVNGPYQTIGVAERVAVNASRTHTCLTTQIVSEQQLVEISQGRSRLGLDVGLCARASQVVKMFDLARKEADQKESDPKESDPK